MVGVERQPDAFGKQIWGVGALPEWSRTREKPFVPTLRMYSHSGPSLWPPSGPSRDREAWDRGSRVFGPLRWLHREPGLGQRAEARQFWPTLSSERQHTGGRREAMARVTLHLPLPPPPLPFCVQGPQPRHPARGHLGVQSRDMRFLAASGTQGTGAERSRWASLSALSTHLCSVPGTAGP